jgi:hypothetical protein
VKPRLIVPVERDARIAFFWGLFEAIGSDCSRMLTDLDARGWPEGAAEDVARNFGTWLKSWVDDMVNEALVVWKATRHLEPVE